MELEGVGAVSVRGLLRHVLGQIDDHDSIKWAFLRSAQHSVRTTLLQGIEMGIVKSTVQRLC